MIEAIGDKIIVEYLRITKTKAGLIIPDGTHEPQGYGKVLSIGDEVKNIKKGIIIVFHTRAGMDMILDSKVHKCLKSEEIYGILKDKELLTRLEPLEMKLRSTIVQPDKKIIT